MIRCWGRQKHNLGLGIVLLIEHNLAKIDLLIKLIEVLLSLPLSGNNHIGFGSSDLSYYIWDFVSQSVGKEGIDRK